MHMELNSAAPAIKGEPEDVASAERHVALDATTENGSCQVEDDLPHPDQIRLHFFDLAVATGSVRFMKKMSEVVPEMLASEDCSIQTGVQKFLAKLSEAEAVERIHGKGAMLNLDHPTVRRLVTSDTPQGRPRIDLEQIGAAVRYQMRRETEFTDLSGQSQNSPHGSSLPK